MMVFVISTYRGAEYLWRWAELEQMGPGESRRDEARPT